MLRQRRRPSWLARLAPAARLTILTVIALRATSAQEDFESRHWSGGAAPTATAVADLNEDGAADVLALSAYAETLSVLLADDAGGFLEPEVLAAPGVPLALATGDLDGDGHTDVVSAQYDTDAVLVFLGAGDGSLQPPATFAVGDQPRDVLLADCDEDEVLDIVTANAGGNSVTLLLGTGDGTFSPGVQIPAGHVVFGVASGDIDGDGDQDLVTANHDFPGTLSVLSGAGDGSFGAPLILQADATAHPGPWRVALADLEGDGDLDLVSFSKSNPPVVSARRNDGSGTFLSALTVGLPANGGALPDFDVADLDLDGRLDVLVPAETPAFAGLYVLRGSATVGLEAAHLVPGGDPVNAVTVADLNGDGLPDVLLSHTTDQQVSVLLANGTLDIGRPPTVPTGGFSATDVETADLDRDGRTDVLVLDYGPIGGNGALLVFENPGTGSLQPPLVHTLGPAPMDAAIGDLDDDGWPDVVVAIRSDGAPTGTVGVLLNDGSGGLLPVATYAAGPSPGTIGVGHVDGDGALDVVVGNTQGTNSLTVLLGDAEGALGPPTTFGTGSEGLAPVPLLVQDVSGDGRADLIFEKVIRLNDGAGGFLPPVTLVPVAADITGLTLADVDEDAIDDLVAVYGVPRVLKGDGAGGFTILSLGTGLDMQGRAEIADVDADGHVDIVGRLYGGVRIAHGDGLGAFGALSTYTAGYLITRPQALDLDDDGRPDLVVVSGYAGTQLPLLLNQIEGSWVDLGSALSGAAPPAGHGTPRLAGIGPLVPGTPVALKVLDGPALGVAALVLGVAPLDAPFKGGTMVPLPALIVTGLPLDAGGDLSLAATWPSGLPAAASIWLQAWMPDPAGPAGFTATNALQATTPAPPAP
jgi:hypothetical protein